MFNNLNNTLSNKRNYTKRILIAIIPSILPTLIFTSYLLIALGDNIIEAISLALILSIINPITYILAVFLGCTSYLVTNIGKKILMQTFYFSGSITIIALFTSIKNSGLHGDILIYVYFFLCLTVLGFIISSLNHFMIQKCLYIKF